MRKSNSLHKSKEIVQRTLALLARAEMGFFTGLCYIVKRQIIEVSLLIQ